MRVSDFSTLWTPKLDSVGSSYNGQLSCLHWALIYTFIAGILVQLYPSFPTYTGYTTFSTNVPIHHHGDTYLQLSLYVQLGLHPHLRLHPHHLLPGGLSVDVVSMRGWAIG